MEIAHGVSLHQSRDTEAQGTGKSCPRHNQSDFRGSSDISVCSKQGQRGETSKSKINSM